MLQQLYTTFFHLAFACPELALLLCVLGALPGEFVLRLPKVPKITVELDKVPTLKPKKKDRTCQSKPNRLEPRSNERGDQVSYLGYPGCLTIFSCFNHVSMSGLSKFSGGQGIFLAPTTDEDISLYDMMQKETL